jgi:hypothetical protein
VLLSAGNAHVISPFSVYCELEKFAGAHGLEFTTLPENRLHATITRFNQQYLSVSEMLFDAKAPSADQFMHVAEKEFQTPIFGALRSFLRESPSGDAVVSRILDVPLMDAKELRAALV